MTLAQKKVELVVRLNKESTRLATLTALVAAGGQVRAACSYWDHHGRVFLLVSEDSEPAAHALSAAGLYYQANSVVLIGPLTQAGVAARLGAAFAAAGIGVLYSYASGSPDRQGYVVFKTTDDDQAVQVATERLAGLNLKHQRRLQAPHPDALASRAA